MPRNKTLKTPTKSKSTHSGYNNDGVCPICSNSFPGMTTKGFARHVRASHPRIYDAGRKLFKSRPVYLWNMQKATDLVHAWRLAEGVPGDEKDEEGGELRLEYSPLPENKAIFDTAFLKSYLSRSEFIGLCKGQILALLQGEVEKKWLDEIEGLVEKLRGVIDADA